MSLTLCGTREKATSEGRSSSSCDGAKRPRHPARPAPELRRSLGNTASGQSPWWSGGAAGRSSRRVQELAQNSPMTARPVPARYLVAIEVGPSSARMVGTVRPSDPRAVAVAAPYHVSAQDDTCGASPASRSHPDDGGEVD